MECGKAPSGVRKVKKKQVKDELDRIKQAEKKKRRLEKALAASAAIISELEKKNQKKREEQQRLDEECAAIAEAVALQVLIGEEPDQKNEEWYPWGCYAGNFDSRQLWGSPNGESGWVSGGYGGSGCEWNGYGVGDVQVQGQYVVERDWDRGEMSEAALMAAQAISSLQIADDGVNAFVFNRMVRG